MWNKFRTHLISAAAFLPEFLMFDTISVIAAVLVIKTQPGFYLFILFIIVLNLFFLNVIGKKRLEELKEINTVIANIRNNKYETAEDIHLKSDLGGIQEEIKEMFNRIKNDVDYLKRLERIRSEFLGNVSHELRTPIFSIQGYIETLLNGAVNDPKVNMNFLIKANQHTINLNNLLNDLIDISMIESGEMRMSFRYFNVKEYLEKIVNELTPLAEGKNIKLILEPVRENLKLYGDKTKLKQVMDNLITNAIKYTEEGNVTVGVEEDKNYGQIFVRDTGIGIKEEDISRIFERFYRVDKARSREVGGTGLGLAIVKHIVEAHGSKVIVESEPGMGSEFSFNLKK